MMQFRMWDRQVSMAMNLESFVEQEIEVEGSCTPVLFAFPPFSVLNLVQQFEQVVGSRAGFDHGHSVQEVVLGYRADGCRLI